LFVTNVPAISIIRILSPSTADVGNVKVTAADVVSKKYYEPAVAVVLPVIIE